MQICINKQKSIDCMALRCQGITDTEADYTTKFVLFMLHYQNEGSIYNTLTKLTTKHVEISHI